MDSDRRYPSNRRICVKKVNTLLLSETLGNKSGFIFVNNATGSDFLLKDSFTTYIFASWRKVSENPNVILHYELDLIVNGFFPEKRFRRVHCFLERG